MADLQIPRVLVLAQNRIQPFTGGGVVLQGLFGGFPVDRTLFIHRDVEYAGVHLHESYKLTAGHLRPDIGASARLAGTWIAARVRGRASISDLKRIALAGCHFELSGALDRRIREFRPEVIYAWTADALWTRTLSRLARRYQIPYVIHFMDNHVEAEPAAPVDRALQTAFRRELDPAASRSAMVFTITDSMGRAYARYWHRPYAVFRGAMQTSGWPWPAPGPVKDGTFRFAFTGSTDRSQLAGLRTVAQALDQLASAGRNVRLVLFLTAEYERMARTSLGSFSCVEFRRHPDSSGLRDALLEMDAMVLAYAHDDESVRYYRYSFATKIVPYMLSGRPILVSGPAEIEPVAYAARGRWAEVVTSPESSAVAAAAVRVMDDAARSHALARAAWEAGRVEHDADEQSRRFADTLSKVARMETRS